MNTQFVQRNNQIGILHIYVCITVLFMSALFFFGFAQNAEAAISFVGSNSATGNSGSFSVDLTSLSGGSGSSAAAGDLVIVLDAFVGTADGNPGVGTAGYTEEQDLYANDTRDANLSVSWKLMTGTPDTTVSCNGSGTGTNGTVCIAYVWRGVDTTTPFDVAEVGSTGINSAVPDPGSITPVTSGAYVLVFGAGTGAAVDSSVTAPTGYSNHVQTTIDPGNAIIAAAASKSWSAGAENPAAWTGWTTSTSDGWAAVTMALRPSAFALSGTLYSDEGNTAITTARTIKVAVGTTTPVSVISDTSDGSGAWSVTPNTSGITTGTPVIAWVEGDPSYPAAVVTRLNGTISVSDLNLYAGEVIARSEDGSALTVSDMATYDGAINPNVPYIADADSGLLRIKEGMKFAVANGSSFTGATTTVLGGGVRNDGTLDLSSSDVYIEGDSTVSGSSAPLFGPTYVGTATSTFINDGAVWTAQTAVGANTWADVTYGEGLFVATACGISSVTTCNSTAGGNRIMTSPDGITWTGRTASEANEWRKIAYGEGRFVTVAPTGTHRVMYSDDGITWNNATAASADQWAAIAYGEGVFTAMSYEGTAMYSDDGITWSAGTGSDTLSVYDITYSQEDGQFVAVGANYIGTSPDGITWTSRTSPEDNWWGDVVYGNGLYVAVAAINAGSHSLMTSPDGITWTARNTPENANLIGIAFTGEMFVAVGYADLADQVITSADGINWIGREVSEANAWEAITYADNTLVAVGSSGTNRVMTSDSGFEYAATNFENDGTTWTARSATEAASWRAIAYGNGRFVAVSTDGTNRVMTSEDGITWTARNASAVSAWRAITYGNGLFVALAHADTTRVMTSPDGILWTSRTAAAANTWRSITYGNGLFVAVSQDGTNRVMTSPDGITWTSRSASAANSWFAVAYGNGIFVAVSTDGTNRVMTSPDGTTWTARSAAENNSWRGLTFGNGLFVAVAVDGTNRVMTSPDGITWTARSAAEANQWNAVTYGGGLFVAVADTGTNRVMTSPDGITWTARSASEANSWFAVAFGEGIFVGTSFDGTNRVMTSSDGSFADTLTTFASNASTTDLTVSASSTLDIQNNLTIYGDFTNNGTLSSAEDSTTYVDVYDATVGYDLANGSYDSVSKGITETNAWGMDFSTDGTKMYVLGYDSDLVREFTLSTAWDVSSASQTNTNSVAGISSFPNSVSISSDGTKIYFTSDDDDTVYQFSLSPAYDVTTASQTGTFDFSAKETSPRGLDFSSDGTKMYVSGESSDSVHQYALSSAWDVSTASFVQSFSFASQDTSPQGIDLSSDGTQLYMSGLINDRIYEYGLSTPWDLSTAAYSEFFEMGNEGFNNEQVDVSTDGTKMYALSVANDTVYQYTIGTEGNSALVNNDKTFSGSMSGSNAFGSLSFAGTGTTTFSNNAASEDFTIASGAIVVAPSILTVDGDFTNNGAFETTGSVTITGSSTLSGTLTGSSALGNLTATSSGEYFNYAAVWEEESAAAADQWSAITYGEGMFVAVSYDWTVMYSSDGVNWTYDIPDNGGSWQDVTYGNGTFVAVANTGTNQVMTSPDGITWTTRAAVAANNWTSVTYGNGKFVAVACGINASSCNTTAGGYRIMISEDGITWTGITAPEANGWMGVGYGEGLFVAVASTGTNRVMTSPDGITWTVRSASGASGWQEVVYAEGLFVAISETDTAMTSPDGITWTARTTPGNSDWYGLAYGGGIFAALGSPLTGSTYAMTSQDGITWTEQTVPNTNFFISLTYGEEKFVAASTNGTNRVLVSSDGTYNNTISFSDNASTTDLSIGDLTTVSAPASLSIADDYTNNGTFTHNDGTVYFNGAVAQTLAGNMASTSAFNGVSFSGNSTKTFTDNATTSDFTIASGATVAAPNALTITGDYTNNGTFTKGSGTVYIEGTTTASTTSIASWDITTATYDGAAFSVTAQETQVTSLAFSPDGTRMFIDGYGSDTVYSYTLSTPWDVTTASYDSKSFSTAGQDAFVEKIAFKDDGTKMYALGSGNDRVFQYTLSSAWDVTTASYDSVSALVNQDASPYGLFIKSDGTRMYVAGNTNDRIYSYTLSTPWVMSSATYDNTSFLISGQETGVQDVLFNTDGTEMYIIGYQADTINQYSLSTAWDVTSASFTGSKSITAQETTPDGIEFNDTGSKIYVHGETASDIFPYSLDYTETTTYTGTTTLSGNMTGTSAFDDLVLDSPQSLALDGVTWTARSAATNNSWQGLVYGEGLFVAVANGGTNRIMTSPDGITWTARTSADEGAGWNAVTYGNGIFVAVAESGTNRVMTSPDGITWTARNASQANTWYSVTYGNGTFVAVSVDGTNRVMTSPDGITWTNRTAAQASQWSVVTYGNSLFVALSWDGTIMTSPDGITWTTRTTIPTQSSWHGIVYAEGLFVAVGNGTALAMTSPDGITWTERTAPSDNWESVTHTGHTFVAVACGITNVSCNTTAGGNRVMTSPDGITWTGTPATEANRWMEVVYANGTLVAVSDTGTNRVMTSNSGTLFGAVVFEDNASTTDLSVTEDTVVTAPTKLSIAGDYTNSGTIEYGTGTTTFNGTSAQTATGTMTGSSAFYNLEIANDAATTSFETALTVDNRLTATSSAIIEFPAGATTTVASFNVVGTAGNEIVLRSTQSGTQWGLDATAHSVYYVDVEDSNACSGNGNITATSSIDSGNNLCWTIIAPEGGVPTLSSAANQTFAVGQATTTISMITVTDAEGTPTITAANDLRITIDTTKTDLLWDTADTTAVFGGTASGKVSNPVSYENGGATLVVPVSSDFSAEDALTISGLSFSQFGSLQAATSAVQMFTGGASDLDAEAADDKTIAITGALVMSDHIFDQATNQFSYQNQDDATVFQFKLAPNGEEITVSELVLDVTGIRKLDTGNLTDLRLYVDTDGDHNLGGGDTQIGGAGVFEIIGQAGSITFSEGWSIVDEREYFVTADTNNIGVNEFLTINLNPSGITSTGDTLGVPILPYGSVTRVQHIRNGSGGGGLITDFDVPEGDGIVGGGGSEGGGGVGEEDNGEEIGNEPGFEAPGATGELYSEWTGGSDALSSDGVYATAASTNLRQSYSLFGFNVPGGNTVQGIEVKLEASGSTGAGTIQVALSWNGDSSVTATKATSVLTGSDAVYTLGGPSDTWGRGWTAAELGDANFVVRVIGQPDQNTVRVDAIQVRPYHQAGGGGGGGGGEI